MTELSVLRRSQSQLEELLAMNSDLERQNQMLSTEAESYREQEMDRNFQKSVEQQLTANMRRESQRFNLQNQSKALEIEVVNLRHLLEQSDYKCQELADRVRQHQKELYEVNNRASAYETELYQQQPKLQEALYQLQTAQEHNQTYQRQIKTLKDENNQKEEELFTLQTEYMSFKRQNTLASDKRESELESIKEKLSFYKKNVERLTGDKDRFKIKLKQAEDSKAEFQKRIHDFEALQETLNQDRKRLDEQLNKMNWGDDLTTKRGVDESMNAHSSFLFDGGADGAVTAVIDENRNYVRIFDSAGKEQLKVRLQEPDIDIEVDKDVLTKDMDNSMLAMETDHQLPIKKQSHSRFNIMAPDFEDSDSYQFHVNAPRRGTTKTMLFVDEELDENNFSPGPEESNNIVQPDVDQQQHHFADRSFVSGNNNSFQEGGNELMLPHISRGGKPSFFGLNDAEEEGPYEQEIVEQNSYSDASDLQIERDQEELHNNHDDEEQEFRMELPVKKAKFDNRFSFAPDQNQKNKFAFDDSSSMDDQDQLQQTEELQDEQSSSISETDEEQPNEEVEVSSSQSEAEQQYSIQSYEQIEFVDENQVIQQSQDVQTDPVLIRQIFEMSECECQTDVQIDEPTKPGQDAAPSASKVDQAVQVAEILPVKQETQIKMEFKSIGTNTKTLRTQNILIQTDSNYFTEQEEVYYKLTRSTQDGSQIQQEARLSVSTMGSFVRTPHDNMNEMYGDSSDTLPKRANSIVKTSQSGKTKTSLETRKNDESCMPGCKVQ